MNSLSQNSMQAGAGLSQGQNSLSDARISSYIRRQSVMARQSLNAGLTIQTREGDLVTLTSSTYAQLDAFAYDANGVLQTEAGSAAASLIRQQVTLVSGESFSFSVIGDLSDRELEDINEIIKGIDAVIAEMADGDMGGAIEKALAMENYDTVSMYAADITYERSLQASVETQQQTGAYESVPETRRLPAKESAASMVPLVSEPFFDHRLPAEFYGNSIRQLRESIQKIAEKLEKFDEQLVAKAQNPVKKLFRHHLDKVKYGEKERPGLYQAIENTGQKIDRYMDKVAGRIFEDALSAR